MGLSVYFVNAFAGSGPGGARTGAATPHEPRPVGSPASGALPGLVFDALAVSRGAGCRGMEPSVERYLRTVFRLTGPRYRSTRLEIVDEMPAVGKGVQGVRYHSRIAEETV
jgi:hypothetical protein